MPSIIKSFLRKLRRAFALGHQAIKAAHQYKHLKAHPNQRFALNWNDRWLHLRDATSTTGFDRHYVFHTAWAARVISILQPKQHLDIASSLYFVSSISAFVPTHFIDFRPVNLGLTGLSSEAGSLLKLPFSDASVESLSCMHVVEHVGLGRYGDPIDYDGDIKAARELSRVIAPGGTLLFVAPIGGRARIQFNAHRIYRYDQVLDMFPEFEVEEFSLIPDDGSEEGLIRNADPALASKQSYGCGCFWLKKGSKNSGHIN